MEWDRISTIKHCPIPRLVRELQVHPDMRTSTDGSSGNMRRLRFPWRSYWNEERLQIQLNTARNRTNPDTKGIRLGVPSSLFASYKRPVLMNDPPTFWPAKADHSADRCQRLPNRQHSQSVRRIRDPPTSQLLLPKMLGCQRELWHVQSRAPSDCGDNQTMATLPRRNKSWDRSAVRSQEPRVFPNLQSVFPKAG